MSTKYANVKDLVWEHSYCHHTKATKTCEFIVSYHLILTYWQKVPVNKRKFQFKTRMKCLNIGMAVSRFSIYVANFVSMYLPKI